MTSGLSETDYFFKESSFNPPDTFYSKPVVVETHGGLHAWPSMVLASVSAMFPGELYMSFRSGERRTYLDPRSSPLSVLSACIPRGAEVTLHAEPCSDDTHISFVNSLAELLTLPEFPSDLPF